MALRKIILGVRTAACTVSSGVIADFGVIDIVGVPQAELACL